MRLVSQGDSHWVSDDERVMVTLDSTFETECGDEPHPMRQALNVFESYSPRYQRHLLALGAKQKGRNMVWQCPGQETHFYSQWTVRIDNEWTHDVYDTFEEAVDIVRQQTGEEVKLVRRKRVVLELSEGEMHVSLEDDASERTIAALVQVGEAARRLLEQVMLEDELRAINENLARFAELLQSEDAFAADTVILAHNQKRKVELEHRLAELAELNG